MNTCLVNKQIEKHNILGFTFKQFHIEQERCAMKVGTDGVLIGAWANGGKRILDIGTGTGLIALMMAQRFDDAEIKAVDLDRDAGKSQQQVIDEMTGQLNLFTDGNGDKVLE